MVEPEDASDKIQALEKTVKALQEQQLAASSQETTGRQ